MYFDEVMSNCDEVNSNRNLPLNSISRVSFARRYQYTKHRQMHSNPMACSVDKTVTRWKVTTELSTTGRPGSLNVALHQSAWTDRRIVGADVFDGFRIGFMSAKRSCFGEMLQWEGYHANVTYCTCFFFICRFVIFVGLNFPMLLACMKPRSRMHGIFPTRGSTFGCCGCGCRCHFLSSCGRRLVTWH